MSNKSTKCCLFYICMTSAGTDMHCQMTSDITINDEVSRKYRVIDYIRVLLLLVLLL